MSEESIETKFNQVQAKYERLLKRSAVRLYKLKRALQYRDVLKMSVDYYNSVLGKEKVTKRLLKKTLRREKAICGDLFKLMKYNKVNELEEVASDEDAMM